MDELLLQVDGVRADDGLFFALQRVSDGRQQIGQGFANTGGSFDDERLRFLQRLRD